MYNKNDSSKETSRDRKDNTHEYGSKLIPPLNPIQPQKVYIIASNHIYDQIKAGAWSPGSRLPPERELSEMLDISRSSVRQALSTLEAIGVLRSKPGVGHFVTNEAMTANSGKIINSVITKGDPSELLEARRIIEPEVASLSAIYRDGDDLARLYSIIREMKLKEESKDFPGYLEVDFNFHLEIAKATHNPIMVDIMSIIIDRMKAPPWQAATYTIVPRTLSANRNEHLEILESITDRQAKEARLAMIRHLSTVAKNIRNISSFKHFTEESTDINDY